MNQTTYDMSNSYKQKLLNICMGFRCFESRLRDRKFHS